MGACPTPVGSQAPEVGCVAVSVPKTLWWITCPAFAVRKPEFRFHPFREPLSSLAVMCCVHTMHLTMVLVIHSTPFTLPTQHTGCPYLFIAACPAGQYAAGDHCLDCNKGFWCPGGTYRSGPTPVPARVACPANMTTTGLRRTSTSSCGELTMFRCHGSQQPPAIVQPQPCLCWPVCFLHAVNVPGTYYNMDPDTKEVSARPCGENTYCPGLRKQRGPVPCPTGFTTQGRVAQTSPSACGEGPSGAVELRAAAAAAMTGDCLHHARHAGT